jgi:hypothetical protein
MMAVYGGAWRQPSPHNDLLLAVALACFYAERHSDPTQWGTRFFGKMPIMTCWYAECAPRPNFRLLDW